MPPQIEKTKKIKKQLQICKKFKSSKDRSIRFKMNTLKVLPENDYRRGDSYQLCLGENQKILFDVRFKLITREGVQPYNHSYTFARFDKTTLPSKAAFYNELTLLRLGSK